MRTMFVLWQDSHLLESGWRSVEDALSARSKVVLCESVGFVLADDEEGVVLAANKGSDEVAGVTVIPRSAVVSSHYMDEDEA